VVAGSNGEVVLHVGADATAGSDLSIRLKGTSNTNLASDQFYLRKFNNGWGEFVYGNTPQTLTGTEGNDSLAGGPGADSIVALGSNDRIEAFEGNDTLDGDTGNDTVSGGIGTNALEGNTGIDTLVVQGTIQSITRLSATSIRVTGFFNAVAFSHTASNFEQVLDNGVLKSVAFFMGTTNVNTVQQTAIAESPVIGNSNLFVAGQTLNGDNNDNTINGGAGHDDIAGFGGNDTLDGNGGDDFIAGGTGNDTANGGNGNDNLSGGAQNDTIAGGNGNDSINGGPGVDTLNGGANADSFVFLDALAGNADVIVDYRVADDTIRILGSLVGGLPAGRLAATRFKRIPQGSIDADDRIIYSSESGRLLFDRNGSASGGRSLIATLPRNLVMSAAEIVIIR